MKRNSKTILGVINLVSVSGAFKKESFTWTFYTWYNTKYTVYHLVPIKGQ